MLITGELDICILGTFNQDFDVITGADTFEEAMVVYVDELRADDRARLKKEILNFLTLSDEQIMNEFSERYPNDISPEYGKAFLSDMLKTIEEKESE